MDIVKLVLPGSVNESWRPVMSLPRMRGWWTRVSTHLARNPQFSSRVPVEPTCPLERFSGLKPKMIVPQLPVERTYRFQCRSHARCPTFRQGRVLDCLHNIPRLSSQVALQDLAGSLRDFRHVYLISIFASASPMGREAVDSPP